MWRAIRAMRALSPLAIRTDRIRPGDILLFTTIRNEALRLPEFLAHYRALGVSHFLFVDNGSADGSDTLLVDQPDVSLWHTAASYRAARFGMDWLGALLMRHGHGHWCLTVDADELFVYPDCQGRDLRALTAALDRRSTPAMGALMVELYPLAPLGHTDAPSDAPLTQRLPYFDAGPFRSRVMYPKQNRWVQGGTRERAFFADRPDLSPTLNKLPLVRWHWRYAYLVSTHSLLPRRLNALYEGPDDPRLSGVLLHSKFLPDVIAKSVDDLERRQHFTNPDAQQDYYQRIAKGPVLWHEHSIRYRDPDQLVELGLMGPGGW